MALGDSIGLKEELIKKACNLAMKAHLKSPEKAYIWEKTTRSSTEAVCAFPGTWAVTDWYSRMPFGETKINIALFPSLKSIGMDELALVNEAFSSRFEQLLCNSQLEREVIHQIMFAFFGCCCLFVRSLAFSTVNCFCF